MDTEYSSVEGVIEDIRFKNDVNGWKVCTVAPLDGSAEVTVVGLLPFVGEGETIKAYGNWVTHPIHGQQLEIVCYENVLPTKDTVILKYLSSGIIKGVGPATALRMIKAFGHLTFDVIENHPLELVKIKGISEMKALQISESFRKQQSLRSIMMFLQSYGITPNAAIRIYNSLGIDAADKIKENPYLLCTEGVLTFEKADNVARKMDFPQLHISRICAAILYVLRHNLGLGHTFLPKEQLCLVAQRLLATGEAVELSQLQGALPVLEAEGEIVMKQVGNVSAVYLRRYYESEQYIATKLFILSSARYKATHPAVRLDEAERELGISLADMQKKAMELAMENGAVIITGGPGTGKTTTLRGILSILDGIGVKTVLCAPTGRAAKRMADLSGREAKTIHRLLEMEYSDETGAPVFNRDAENPIDAGAVIIDEMSMVDTLIFEALLRALRTNVRLIMVGDADQLPAVGAGNVLHDMIASGRIPVVELDHIFRQAEESLIIVNAHRINHGELPDISHKDRDFFFLPSKEAVETAETIVALCKTRLPKSYGEAIREKIQVITPTKKTDIGTVSLNRALQRALNPPSAEKEEYRRIENIYRIGDKVMQIRNNYDMEWVSDSGEEGEGVFNGDIGVITDINSEIQSIDVRFDDRMCSYSFDMLDDLELAYAMTIHKSQGNEFGTVIIPLIGANPNLYTRKLLYTAVTRAKDRLILVGDPSVLKAMVENDRDTKRFSGLKYFLASQ